MSPEVLQDPPSCVCLTLTLRQQARLTLGSCCVLAESKGGSLSRKRVWLGDDNGVAPGAPRVAVILRCLRASLER